MRAYIHVTHEKTDLFIYDGEDLTHYEFPNLRAALDFIYLVSDYPEEVVITFHARRADLVINESLSIKGRNVSIYSMGQHLALIKGVVRVDCDRLRIDYFTYVNNRISTNLRKATAVEIVFPPDTIINYTANDVRYTKQDIRYIMTTY